MKKRKNTPGGSRTTANSSGLVIEASNRKARRKEQRHFKKIKKQQYQHHHDAPPPILDEKVTSSKKTKKSTRSDSSEPSNKRVKFSNTVEEKLIPAKQSKSPSVRTSSLRKSRSLQESDAKNTKAAPPPNTSATYYSTLDDETAAALRRDDLEIEYLESNLGIAKSKSERGNRELNREYAKNEGYGEDFGDFLMGLDDLVERCVGGDDDGSSDEESDEEHQGAYDSGSEEELDVNDSDNDNQMSDGSGDDESMSDEDRIEQKHKKSKAIPDSDSDDQEDQYRSDMEDEDFYANLDEETAIAFRNDDAEIAQLEEKLGLSSDPKAKKKLNKEFAKIFCGYGEDFGDFLDDLDSLAHRVRMGKGGSGGGVEEHESDDDSDGESDAENSDEGRQHNDKSDSDSGSDSDDSEASDAPGNAKKDADHDVALTYRPTAGEDIYGNKVDSNDNETAKPTKYIPPHLRKKLAQDAASNNDTQADNEANNRKSVIATADPETVKLIQRSLNHALNRLSENTLESVSKSIASLYSEYPFHDMNDCLWKNIKSACIPPYMVMSGLIPLYIAAMAGVHWIGGDRIQLGGCLIEWSVKQLHDSLEKGRGEKESSEGDDERYELINKEASNALLIVCYLYNYGVVHCTLIYDLVKDLIKNFSEIDVESLLLILSHCGQQMRSDDPSALREIVLMVKDRAQKASDSDGNNPADSSRVVFMLSTITELKNNKPRKQDAAIREKAGAFRKCIGRMKSSANNASLAKGTGSCLRITLQDVLNAETKGRWWMVGASWAGNQKFIEDEDSDDGEDLSDTKQNSKQKSKSGKDSEEEKLLALASLQRMNTDTRRSIFCIVMGSSDCNDAFVKLARAELLKPKNERDVIRVLVHCCGEEKSFNPFYAHLIMRVCEYQQKSKFTLMLSFWDIFKQLESFSDRKTANLAKLLAKLLLGTKEKYLTLGVLKRIEFSPTDMPEQLVLFLSIVMSSLFETTDRSKVREIFDHDVTNKKSNRSKKRKRQKDVFDSDEEDEWNEQPQTSKKEDLGELKESIATFLLQYVQSSPNNSEGSKFRENFAAAMKACEQTSSN